MPVWRCPHCGTPQAETARCWVCRRSSTSCATCRHYRQSVAAQLGYCGLDRRRQPLTGDEIRGCWEGWPSAALPDAGPALTIAPARPIDGRHRQLEFVEVDGSSDTTADPAVAGPPIAAGLPRGAEPGWNLWGDPDR